MPLYEEKKQLIKGFKKYHYEKPEYYKFVKNVLYGYRSDNYYLRGYYLLYDDVINENDYSVLIKLYEPLPIELGLKFKCWVVESISTPQTYQVKFPIPIFDPQDFEFISGPNLSLNIKDESGVSSKEYSYETLVNSNITSSTSQIQSLLEEKGIKININYAVGSTCAASPVTALARK